MTGAQNVKFTSNPGHGQSGTCFGDSGGPHFINNTSTIVAVTSYGVAANYKGNEYNFRADIPLTYDFVTPYLR